MMVTELFLLSLKTFLTDGEKSSILVATIKEFANAAVKAKKKKKNSSLCIFDKGLHQVLAKIGGI